MDKKTLKRLALEAHKKFRGKWKMESKVPLSTRKDMSLFYTPGVAAPCLEIEKDPQKSYLYTSRGNTVAIITNGTAVLGLGDIGALAGMPVMEGKCVLFKKFGNVDAIPICINSHDHEEIIRIIKAISPSFGGINLEDISAPSCFIIEERLKKELDIPVFHDDQHGTAIVCLAGIINALTVVKKDYRKIKVVISGAGAAGTAIAKLLLKYGIHDLILIDSKGVIDRSRKDLNPFKKEMAGLTNPRNVSGGLADAMKDADIFIGVSRPNLMDARMVKIMAKDPVIFAMSNPDPEISPIEAKKGGARIIATGRSDYPNQINNVLAFPGIFRGVFDVHAKKITDEMKIAAAIALAKLVKKPTPEKIIPGVFDKRVCQTVAKAVVKSYNAAA